MIGPYDCLPSDRLLPRLKFRKWYRYYLTPRTETQGQGPGCACKVLNQADVLGCIKGIAYPEFILIPHIQTELFPADQPLKNTDTEMNISLHP